MQNVVVTGSFDDLRSRQVRLLEEASKLGSLTVYLWSDETIRSLDGARPKFPLEERRYLLESIRFVSRVVVVEADRPSDMLAWLAADKPAILAVPEREATPALQDYCAAHTIPVRVITESELEGFPVPENGPIVTAGGRKKVVVTGCYDWLHSGHVRFFEEVSALGDLYVVVGHDANVRHLKGEGHPLFSEDERLYMVYAVRFVTRAYLTSGWGWMDAEPEITQVICPDMYAVNEDGDVPEKRAFCDQHGLEYVVLKRKPKDGLPRRESTFLRGF